MRAFSYSRLALASARSAWKNSLRALMMPSHSDGVAANSSPPSRVVVPTWHHVVVLVFWRRGSPCAVARSQGRGSGGLRCGARHAPRPGVDGREPPRDATPRFAETPFRRRVGRVRVTHCPDELSPTYRDVDVPPRAECSTRSGRCGSSSWTRPLHRRGLGGGYYINV